MTHRRLAALPMLLLLAAPAPGQAPSPRDQQVADIEKQIADLTRKLADLKAEAAKPAPAPPAPAASGKLPADWIKALRWRPIGPANMGGRIVALAVHEADPNRYWVATAGGGLLKTANNGVTFEHQFDREATVSVGDVAVAPSDPEVVWVGTGESNPRNSVSYGDGVYKSTDGGKTWANMGLKGSFQVGRVLIHPKDPNVVYVGALGRLYGPNEERGLFKTTDGGKTWQKVLYVDDRTGVIDARMSPADPETLLVAMYERRRDEFDVNEPAVRWGPGSGLYKTTDGGKSFRKITQGLPACALGRIGLDYARKDPKVVFAVVESEKTGMGPPGARPAGASAAYLGISGEDLEGAEGGALLNGITPGGPAEKGGLKAGDRVVAAGDKPVKSYQALVEAIRARQPGDKVKLNLVREDKPVELEITLETRPPGGGRPGAPAESGPPRPFASMLNGQVENAQDRQGADGSQYGGVYKSTDGGESWTRVNSLNPRPMYFSQVRVDPTDGNVVYVLGIALHRSTDGGKTFRGDAGPEVHADGHALWIDPRDGRHMVVGTDGGSYVSYDRGARWDHLNHAAIGQFYGVAVDTRRDYRAYGGLQDNGTWGGPSFTRSRTGPVNEDWVNVAGGDGFTCKVDPDDADIIYFASQYGGVGRRNMRTGESGSIRPQAVPGKPLRFNWNTPFVLSHHNARIYYVAGNFLHQSLDRGKDLRVISPELSRTDKGTAAAISESPRNAGVLWVGTDDGHLWVTRDGGKEWAEVSKNVGLPGPRWVATIEASRFAEGRCYVAFDGHRSDDDDPHPYVTEDFGKTWKSLRGNLPRGSTRCLREDIKNEDLLYCGTEFALWASIDRGAGWDRINNDLPTVAIHEVAIHPTAGEIVVATHGRSLWVLDVSALRQITPEVLAARAMLFAPVSAVRWKAEPSRGRTNRQFAGQNPPAGAAIYYALPKAASSVGLKVVDYDGTTLRDLRATTSAGLHRSQWDLLRPAPPRDTPPRPSSPSGITAALGNLLNRRGGSFAQARRAEPGTYRVVLTVDGQEFSKSLRVEADPSVPASELLAEGEEGIFDEDAEERAKEEGVTIDD